MPAEPAGRRLDTMRGMNPWPAPPLITADWKDLDPAEGVALAALLGAALAEQGLSDAVATVLVRRFRAVPLSFYPGWLLVEFEARLPDGGAGLANFLYGPGRQIVLLDGTSAPIHRTNLRALAPLDAPGLAIDYLRLFCGQLFADEGRFLIVESEADLGLRLAGGRASPAIAAQLAPMRVRPPAEGEPADGWIVDAHILYGSTLFSGTYHLSSGDVQMIGDEALGEVEAEAERWASPFRLVGEAPALLLH